MTAIKKHYLVTNLHRESGGLRLLDFIVNSLRRKLDTLNLHELQILIVNDSQGRITLPLLSLGYNVKALFKSKKEEDFVKQLSQEFGFQIKTSVSTLSQETQQYQAIIVYNTKDSFLNYEDFLIKTQTLLTEQGSVFFNLEKNFFSVRQSYQDILNKIRDKGFRIYYTEKIYFKNKKQLNNPIGVETRFQKINKIFLQILKNEYVSSWAFECRLQKQKKLLVQVIPSLEVRGGAEKLISQFADKLADHGFEVITIINKSKIISHPIFFNKHLALLIVDRKKKFGYLKNILELRQLLINLQPNIVNTHLFGADLWGRLSAYFAKVPNVCSTIHNVDVGFGLIGRLIMIIMRNFSQYYIAISPQVAQYIANNLKIPKSQIVLIPNGVDTLKIIHRGTGPFHDIPQLLFVGRLEAQKNITLLFKALATINRPWNLSIIGQGSLKKDLIMLADHLNITPRIKWLGTMESVLSTYGKYDIFILPSIFEGYGLVAAEAAVAGVPLILSDLAVLKELFQDNEVLFFKSNNQEDLAKRINYALNHSHEVLERAQKLQLRAEKEFSLENTIKQYVRFYNKLLQKK